MLDLVTIGDIKHDLFVPLPEASVHCRLRSDDCQLCLDYGRKIPTEHFVSAMGGTAANVARGLARLGLRSGVVSGLGSDAFARQAKSELRADGVMTRYITMHSGAQSPEAVVLMHRGESTHLVNHATLPLSLPEPLPRTRAIFVGELGSGQAALFTHLRSWKRAHPDILLAMNPGATQIKESSKAWQSLLSMTDLLFVNTREARALLRVASGTPARLGVALHQETGGRVIVTDGAHGAYATDGREGWYAPLFPGPKVESTGAGDAFATGVLAALLQHHPIPEALTWGSALATSVVHAVGPSEGLLSRAELRVFLRTQPSYRTQTFRV